MRPDFRMVLLVTLRRMRRGGGASGFLGWQFGVTPLGCCLMRIGQCYRYHAVQVVPHSYCVGGVWCGPLCILCLVSPYLLQYLRGLSDSTYGRSGVRQGWRRPTLRDCEFTKVTLWIRDKDGLRGLACELTLTTWPRRWSNRWETPPTPTVSFDTTIFEDPTG